MRDRLATLFLAAVAAGCFSVTFIDPTGRSCTPGERCPEGWSCLPADAGYACLPVDAGVSTPDGGFDAGGDAGTDAGADGGGDAGADGGDAGHDGGMDAGPDAGPDGGLRPGCTINILTQNQSLPLGTGTGAHAAGIAQGDFNGDGLMDFVVVDPGTSSYVVYLNDAGGTFRQATASSTLPCVGVAALDVDQDGHLDLVAVSFVTEQLLVFLGAGDGTFQTPLVFPLYPGGVPDAGILGPTQVVIGDFNGDGLPDFAVLDDNSLAPLENSGDVRLFLGQSDGGVSYGPVVLAPNSASFQALAVGDLNRDGFDDVVVGDGTGDLYVALSLVEPGNVWTGLGPVTDVPGLHDNQFGDACPLEGNPFGSAGVVLADVNGDGFPDAITAHPTQDALLVFLNDGTGQLNLSSIQLSVGLADAGGPVNLTVADVNGDGLADLIAVDGAPDENSTDGCLNPPSKWGAALSYLLGLPDGGFGPPVVQPVTGIAPAWILAGSYIPGQATPSLVISFESPGGPNNDHLLFYPNTCE